MAGSAPPLVRTAVATLSVGQRIEDDGITLRRGVLRVDRHRRRAPTVGPGRHELGVAQEVARVAPHRTATRLVAEDPQPSSLPDRADQSFPPGRSDAALLATTCPRSAARERQPH